MTTNKTHADTIDFKKARLVSTFDALNRQLNQNDDLISRLTRRLQTTLDLRQVINIFIDELGKLISFDQFEYSCDAIGSLISSKKRSAHSCNYKLTLENEDLGEITFTRSKKFTEEELAIIEKLMTTLVFPLRNAILYKQALNAALQDALTGCGNKRAMDINLHREAELAKRHNQDLSVMIVDVDHFKHINDNHGHAAGDEVLKQLAHCLKTVSRRTDLCFRFGGEEFVIILTKTSPAGARIISERLRRAVETSRFFFHDQEIPVSVSIGTATYHTTETLSHFIDRADKALYRAKKIGRNKVVSAEVRPNIKSGDFVNSVTNAG